MTTNYYYLSFRSLTALTYDLKLSSPIHLSWWSSHRRTLFIGNLGWVPPPTRARILHLKSISTMPIPPSNSVLLRYRSLTSFEIISERESIEYTKSFLGTTSEASLVLIEPDVQNLIFSCHLSKYQLLILLAHMDQRQPRFFH